MPTFWYDKIEGRPDGDYIRILELAPSHAATEPIRISLATVKLADAREYEALSYCWGDPNKTTSILCLEDAFQVTEHLGEALRQLRLTAQPRMLWIDAICINQEDLSERAHQVTLMPNIYRSASRVLVWLGSADVDSDLVFPLCERMVQDGYELLTDRTIGKNHDELLWGANRRQLTNQKLAEGRRRRAAAESQSQQSNSMDGENGAGITASNIAAPEQPDTASTIADDAHEMPVATSEEASAFLKLLSRPWFTRCWVLQELCLGKEVLVLCGESSLDWDLFHLGFTLAIVVGERAREGRPEQLLSGGMILMMLMRLRLQYPDAQWDHADMLWLLWHVLPLHSSDPRDKIYSILGLIDTEELQTLNIRPDYTISVEDCYRTATLAIMSSTKNLDVLLTDRASVSAYNLPSWVPDWSAIDRPTAVALIRDEDRDRAADPKYRVFRASSCEDWNVTPIQDNPKSLAVSGYIFDRIVALEDVLTVPQVDHLAITNMTSSFGSFGTFVKHLFTGLGTYFDILAGWEKLSFSKRYADYPTGEDVETVLAITMCAGNVDGPKSALDGFRKFRKTLRGPKALTWLKGLGVSGGVYKAAVATTGIISGIGTLEDNVYRTQTERVLYRRLARTEKGYLAIVPKQSTVGDQVVLLKGGKMPFVTRQKPGGDQIALLGACYVHGIMYGEAWDSSLCRHLEIV